MAVDVPDCSVPAAESTMQFHLNGFRPGDPDVSEADGQHQAGSAMDALPTQVDVRLPQFASRSTWRDLRPALGRAISILSVLALPSACADSSASLDRKMSQIRREQCDPLPTQLQRAACIRQVTDIEDDARGRLDEARRQQAIQGTMDQVRVINQSGR